jgi:hypothetical protein
MRIARRRTDTSHVILKRASTNEWSDDDYDVVADGAVVGRIMRAAVGAEGTPWLLARRFLLWRKHQKKE